MKSYLIVATSVMSLTLSACDAQTAKTPDAKPADEAASKKAPSPRLATVENFGQDAMQVSQNLGETGLKIQRSDFAWFLGISGGQWAKLASSMAGLFRLEQLLGTTEGSQAQRDIVAQHYSYAAQDARGLEMFVTQLEKYSPSDAKYWADLRGKIRATETFCRKSCAELAPELSRQLEQNAAEANRIMNDVEKGKIDARKALELDELKKGQIKPRDTK